MSLKFQVLFKKTLNVEDLPDFDSDGDDGPLALLGYVCEKLDDDNACEFNISGFGEDVWPVDVYTDLSVFLEQIPFAIDAVGKHKPFVIDFYEQGVERTLSFSPKANEWSVNCEYTYAAKSLESISIGENELAFMLNDVKTNFLKCVEPIKLENGDWSKVVSDWENGNF